MGMIVTDEVKYIGVNDHEIDLFEGQYIVKHGMAYNSYVILDDKITVMDTVDRHFAEEWLSNLEAVLDGRKPDYLVIQHMEPDHSAGITALMERYPEITVVATAKAFAMMKQFYGNEFENRRILAAEGGTLQLGRHTLTFLMAPMVHWPEVMMTYDACDKILFSADGFGKFGALDVEEDWACEARRYYFGIVGKYGMQVQNVLKKVSGLEIAVICPLHGPVLKENLEYYLNLYQTWASYEAETEGIAIAYNSVYGNTAKAAMLLADALEEKGCPKIAVSDLARCDMAEAVEDAFRYGTLVLAGTTYNAELFPCMKTFIAHLVEHGYRNRKVAFMENGSWAATAAKCMRQEMEKCKDITFVENTVRIMSALNEESLAQIDALAEELCAKYQ